MVQFLDPEIAKILQFLDPEIVKMDKKIHGSRNRRNGAISGSRNRRKGRQILYQTKCAVGNARLRSSLPPVYLSSRAYLPTQPQAGLYHQAIRITGVKCEAKNENHCFNVAKFADAVLLCCHSLLSKAWWRWCLGQILAKKSFLRVQCVWHSHACGAR